VPYLLLVDPTPDQFQRAVRLAVADAHYSTEHIVAGGSDHPPFPRRVIWASRNTPAGHWQSIYRPTRSVRRYGIAWHVDESGHRHIRVFGVAAWNGRMPDYFALPAFWDDDPPDWAYVYPNFPPPIAELFKAAGREWQASILERPNDWLRWLVLADHLDELGWDATPIRQFFQADPQSA
jgi:hypothetical protein